MAQLPRIFLFCRTAMGRVWRLGGRIRENTSAGGCGEEHDIVDREIGDLPLAGYLALIGQYECLLDMVVLILDKGVERAVYGIVLAGLDLKGDGGKAAVIVDQVIDLALAAVVIVVQLTTRFFLFSILVRMRSPVRIWVAAPKIPENFGFWGFFVAKSCFVGWSKISDPHRDPHAEMKQWNQWT